VNLGLPIFLRPSFSLPRRDRSAPEERRDADRPLIHQLS